MLKHKKFISRMFDMTAEEKLESWVKENNIKKSDIASISYLNASILTVFYYSKEND